MRTLMPQLHLRAMAFGFALLTRISSGTLADNEAPYAGTVIAKAKYGYGTLVDRLVEAVGHYKMGVVAPASTALGARRLGAAIAGNQVIMVFTPDSPYKGWRSRWQRRSKHPCVTTSPRTPTAPLR